MIKLNAMSINNSLIIYSIGHSNHSLEYFISLLHKYNIEAIADIRRFPRSKKFPYFSKENLKAALNKNKIEYYWLGYELGGFRKSQKGEGSFSGYKEHMKTELFKNGEEALIKIALKKRTAFMCAESLYFRCHRLLLSEDLVEKGYTVIHINGDGKSRIVSKSI